MVRINFEGIRSCVVIIFLSFLIYSCDASFKVNEEFISTSGDTFSGFTIDKIVVLDQDESGLPTEYSEGETVWLVTETTKKGRKKIYFKKVNENYQWSYSESPELFDILPIEFEIGSWYHITGLEKSGSPDYQIFIHVLENRDFELFDKHTPRR